MQATIRYAALAALALLLAACAGTASTPRAPGASRDPGATASPSLKPRFDELKGNWVLSMLKGTETLAAEGFAAPTLVFGASYGEASGSGGCNSYGASYTLDGEGGLSFGEFWSTKMFCIDAPAETAYFAMVSKVRRYMISGKRLAFLEEDGTLLALFERAEGSR